MQVYEFSDSIKVINDPDKVVALCSDPYMSPISGGTKFLHLDQGHNIKVGDWIEFDYTDGSGQTWKVIDV